MTTDDDATPEDPIQPDHIVQAGGLADAGFGLPSAPAGGGHDDPLAALLGGDAGLDFGALMEQAANLQSQLLAAQQETAHSVVEGVAGGGAVKVEVTGAWEFQKVTIAPSAVDPDDVDMLQDLVLAALHDAAQRIEELQEGAVDLKGLGLGDLFGGGN